MRIKKGDLVKLNFPPEGSVEVKQDLLSSLLRLSDDAILIAVTAPYEHEQPVIGQTRKRGRMFMYNSLMLCIDLLLNNQIYKAVPIKYLERAKQ
tara:strand:- start:251 stop:532 length:282 start_codon:yes stop_codon:yes gene_type:complete